MNRISDLIEGGLNFHATENQDQRRELEKCRTIAEKLARQLAPLFPVVSAATRSDVGLQAWADSWGRQILAHRLTESELLTGLSRIAEVMIKSGNPPFSFPLFLAACRPLEHLSAADMNARRPAKLALDYDVTTDRNWIKARDKAFARLREMGYCRDKSAGDVDNQLDGDERGFE